jgi:valyl-tRNA synthetase
VIHGTVRDEKGIKMSKSLGNTIDPLVIIEKFGTDALRFSLMMLAASGSDVFLSEEKFLVGRNFCNKVWNATRFLFMQIEKNSIKITDLKFDHLEPIDKWLLQEFNNTAKSVDEHIENYRVNEAAKVIYEFFWHTFCDWYVEIVKDNFTENRAKILISVLIDSLKIMHPFIPYITEEIYTTIGRETGLGSGSVMQAVWPQGYAVDFKPGEEEQIRALIDTVTQIRNIKADLGLSAKKIDFELSFKAETGDLWHNNKEWVARLAGLEKISFRKSLKRALCKNEWWDFGFEVSELDSAAFLGSLEKKILNIENFTAKMAAKLNNENFVKNAPQEVVVNDRERFSAAQIELKRLKELHDAFR